MNPTNEEKIVYYNIEERDRFSISISCAKNVEDLSDNFIDSEDYRDLTGRAVYHASGIVRNMIHSLIKSELETLMEQLVGSGKKTILIGDDELVTALKDPHCHNVADYIPGYCRHGDRLQYSRTRRRRKTKVTKTDARDMWGIFGSAFFTKFGTHMPYVPMWYRRLTLFKVYKKLIGWRKMCGHMERNNIKFYREIWDNPEEHYS